MRRLVLVIAALACGGIASAQQARWDVYPVTAPVRHAGTVDIATGAWSRTPDGTQEAGSTVLYDNTCVWSGGAFYAGLESCEVLYDEGNLPGTGNPSAPAGAADTYQLRCFDIAYCTFHPAPFRAKVGFWNNLGGPCVGGTPPSPPPPSTTATAYFDLSPLGLPGSTASGFQACWIVTVDVGHVAPVLLADGNGAFQGSPASDLFTWSFEHASPTNPSGPDGLILSGDPAVGVPGACTFSNPCPAGCGTGLGTLDSAWINVDGVAVGDTTSGLCSGGYAPFGGTNCYFFGGYPTNPFTSFWLRLEGEPFSGCPPPSVYCTPKTSSSGCTPSVASSGTPTPGGGFTLLGTDIEGGQIGVGIYSLSGPHAAVFQGGFLCIQPPIVRLPVQGSGGSVGTCSGSFSTSLQPLVNMLLPGTQVWIQYWFRDSGAATGTGLSDALTFIRC